MTTIIHRSALVFHGHKVADDLAYVVIDHHGRRVVTWSEVLKSRREWQLEILRRKREGVGPWRAVKLWVAYFDQSIFGGWQAFIENWRGRDQRIWIDRDDQGARRVVMSLYPLVLPFGTVYEQWEEWKPVFAKRFKRRTHDRRPLGVAYLWMRDGELALSPHCAGMALAEPDGAQADQ